MLVRIFWNQLLWPCWNIAISLKNILNVKFSNIHRKVVAQRSTSTMVSCIGQKWLQCAAAAVMTMPIILMTGHSYKKCDHCKACHSLSRKVKAMIFIFHFFLHWPAPTMFRFSSFLIFETRRRFCTYSRALLKKQWTLMKGDLRCRIHFQVLEPFTLLRSNICKLTPPLWTKSSTKAVLCNSFWYDWESKGVHHFWLDQPDFITLSFGRYCICTHSCCLSNNVSCCFTI